MAPDANDNAKKMAALGVLDFCVAGSSWCLARNVRGRALLARFVVEPWGIGDVVLSTALLRASGEPQFSHGLRITLMAKARGQAVGGKWSGGRDRRVRLSWTAFTGKASSRVGMSPREFQELLSRLRARDFDVSRRAA